MYSKIILFILLPIFAFSQAPQKINFQSILRNTNGAVVSDKSVSLKISILSGSISGSSVYSEIHTITTDISGLISLQIGNGTVLSGVFANIGWGDFPHFIKLEADFNGGSNYVVLGTQELMSVPYALYASKTDTSSLNLVNRLGEKVNVSDTSTMLSNYRTGLNSKVNIADTSNMLSNYRTGLNEKVNVSDTSTMLSNYRTGLNEKVNVSDTSTMLTNYRTGLNEKVNVSDTSTMLNPYLRKASIQNSTLELFGIHSWEYPEGFSKEFVIISNDNLPYTVPSGKNLYTFNQVFRPIISGIPYWEGGQGGQSMVFKEGTIITGFENSVPSPTQNMAFGFLVNKTEKIIPVNFPLNSTTITYTVPVGKILIIKSGGSFRIGNKGNISPFGFAFPIFEGITINTLDGPNTLGFTGYLLNK